MLEFDRCLFLTGCCGFIGLNFLDLCAQDHTLFDEYDLVLSFDLFERTYTTQYNLLFYRQIEQKFFNKIYKFISIPLDLSQKSEFKAFVEKCLKPRSQSSYIDVINFASISHIDVSIQNPEKVYENNVLLASNMNLIRPIIRKFLHISTDEVYGHLSLEELKNTKNWFTPQSPLKPRNPYSASKAAQDLLFLSWKNTYSFPCKIVRLSNQFGPYQHPEKAFPKFIFSFINNESYPLYGDGSNFRQWTPVEMTVETIAYIFKHFDNIESTILHISYPYKSFRDFYTNKQCVQKWNHILKTHFGRTVCIQNVTDRPGHDFAYALKECFYIPDRQQILPLDIYFEKTILWYNKNFNKIYIKD